MTLKEAYNKLCEELRDNPNVQSVGIAEKNEFNGEDRLYVYRVRGKNLESTYLGFRVSYRTVGKLEIKLP